MQIITHDGLFHADEVFACALLLEFYDRNLEIVRTRHLTKEHFTSKYFLIDQGRVLEPENLNFDHHQYKNGLASNMLILDWLYDIKKVPKEFYDGIRLDMLGISHVDTNGYDFKSMNSTGSIPIFHVNNFFKVINHLNKEGDENFEDAIMMARMYLKGQYRFNVLTRIKSKEIWDKGVTYGKVRELNEYPHFWKEYNQENFILYPDDDKWVVQSKDSTIYPLQEKGNEVFFHKNKFIAVFENKFDALQSLQ